MARPLQKKKNKSSLPRVRQKPKSKRINIKSNPIVAANWDQSLTLSQNYRRLGLSSKLNACTGGTEVKGTQTDSGVKNSGALAIPSTRKPKILETTEVKVVRDPESGAIISVAEDASRRRAAQNPLNDPLNSDSDLESENENVEKSGGATSRGIVPQLEEAARYSKKKRPRVQSERERVWIEQLVSKWGSDWGGMSRDRRLNAYQQTERDIKKRVEVWKKSQKGSILHE